MGLDDGTSWSNAYVDFQDALNAAVPIAASGTGSGPYVEIWVAKGTYKPSVQFNPYGVNPSPADPKLYTFLLIPQVAVYGGFDGTETSFSQRNITPYVRNGTVFSCDLNDDDDVGLYKTNARYLHDSNDTTDSGDQTNLDNCRHVFYADNDLASATTPADANTILDGITVTGGHAAPQNPSSPSAEPGSWQGISGGGIFSSNDSAPTVRNAWFEYNYAFLEGGAINARGKIDVSSSVFQSNHAANGNGGAIMPGSHFAGNVGGAVIRTSKFFNNVGFSEGGAINVGDVTDVVIDRCEFVGNELYASGGAISLAVDASATISNSLFYDNRAGITDILNKVSSAAAFRSAVGLSTPSSRDGGAIAVRAGSNANLYNLTIVANSVDFSGGFGGGVILDTLSSGGSITMQNTILWENTLSGNAPNRGRELYCNGPCDISWSNIKGLNDDDSVTEVFTTNIDESAPGLIDSSPGFIAFPSPNVDFHLSSNSQMIDAGDPIAGSVSTLDIDGDARSRSGTCGLGIPGGVPDLGADEYFVPACWVEDTKQCFGDANTNGAVNAQDAGIFLSSSGTEFGDQQYDACADFDRDGDVDGDLIGADDKDILLSNMNSLPTGSCPCVSVWPPH